MTGRRAEIVVGATVIVALVIAVAGVLWLGNYRLGRTRNVVGAVFEDGSGVKEGDPVTVYGVNKGKVQKIVLDRGKVRLELLIDSDVVLHRDAQALILDAGLMGEKRVEVRPGQDPAIFDMRQPIQGSRGGGLTETVRDVGALAFQVGELVTLLRKDVLNQETSQSLRRTLEHAEKVTQELEAMAEENRENLRRGVSDFRSTSSQVKRLMETRGDDLGNLIQRLDVVSARLDTLTQKVERGEGTLGRLVKDDELYDNLKSTAKGLDDLIKDVKEHPEKYIKLKIF